MTPNPIKVMFVVPALWVGGAERHLTTLLPRMDPERFAPSVVCIGDDEGLFTDLEASGIPCTALHRKKRQAVRALRELASAMRIERPDVVVVRGYSAETLGRTAAALAGVQHTIMWVHNNSTIRRRGIVHRTVDRFLDRWTSRYFGVAEAQRRYLVDELGFPGDKVRIIHNGVDPAQFDITADRSVLAEFGFAQDDPVVGILAGLTPVKDHATFLRAARTVVGKIPMAKFLVIGDGPARAQLEELTSELRITANVHFAGQRGDIARLLPAIDVFTLTSTTECFPMSVLEAMACGRPTVCTAVGGIPEMVEDGVTGYLVAPKDSRRLSERLVSLLSDPQVAPRMGRAGRARIEAEFNLDRSVEAAQRAIEDTVMRSRVLSGRGV
jgi:glycosyltransferase involved in cell wall biosynthesis